MSTGSRKRLLIIGTHGVPAQYGGFETLVENLVSQLEDFEITVFNSSKTKGDLHRANLHLVKLPLSASGIQGVLYDLISLTYSLFIRNTTVLYLGPTIGVGLLLPWLRRHRIVTNFGGLDEWSRPKYQGFAKLIKFNYWSAAKLSSCLIADNCVLQRSLKENFDEESAVIRYGGDHLNPVSFQKKNYIIVVARAQTDSMFDLLIEAFESMPHEHLIIVSNWESSNYGVNCKRRIAALPNIDAIGPIYNKIELSKLRLESKLYIHSHSKCGTAPSLVEAISLSCPIICYDVETNREVTKNRVKYFKSSSDLIEIIDKLNDSILYELSLISSSLAPEFEWRNIGNQYREVL